MPATFIQIPIALINYLEDRKLTGLQYRLWLYLYSLDPFGDRYVTIPQPEAIAAKLGVCAKSVQRAAQRLIDLDLFDFNINSWSAKNLILNNSARTKRSQSGQKDPDVPTRTKRSQNRQKDPDVSLGSPHSKGCQSSQTIQNLNTLSDIREDKKINSILESQKPEILDPWLEDNISHPSSAEINIETEEPSAPHVETLNENNRSEIEIVEVIDLDRETVQRDGTLVTLVNNGANTATNASNVVNDNCSNPLPDKDYSQTELAELLNNDTNGANTAANGSNYITTSATVITTNNNSNEARSNANPFNWLVPGPWNIDGKLDPNFRDWLAKDWIGRYGGTIHQKRADVLAHFKKDPANLPIRWEQYHSEYLSRFTNAQTRMTNGMSIDPTEQEQLLEHTAAVTNPLPPEMNPIAPKKELSPSGSADLKNADDTDSKKKLPSGVSSDRNSSNDLPPKDRDKSNLPAHEIPENPDAYKYWQSEKIEPLTDPKSAIDLLKSALTMPPPALTRAAEYAIDKLNSCLNDPILYSEALKRAKNHGYSIEFNENGRAVRISEPEF